MAQVGKSLVVAWVLSCSGDSDVTEALPRSRPVDKRRLLDAPVDVLQRGQEVDHVEADVHPGPGDDETGHDVALHPRELEVEADPAVEPDVQESGVLLEDGPEQERDKDDAGEGRREVGRRLQEEHLSARVIPRIPCLPPL